MADKLSNQSKIIVKKPRRRAGEHHPGAWKVAYADLVTAMMSFFLLLWILNVTTDDQRKGIAEYFAPESVSRAVSGSGQILEGFGLSSGALPRDASGLVLGVPASPTGGETDEEFPDKTAPPRPTASALPRDESMADLRTARAEDLRRELEEREFARVERDLRSAIEDIPALRLLRESLLIDRTSEGLRIQIVDQQKLAMFPLGSPVPNAHMQQLMGLVAQAVMPLPNPISITGHTDSLPYRLDAEYTNWELSLDRANASRRALIANGLPPARVSRVVGKAQTDPLFPASPTDPRNRRMSIVLMRDVRLPEGAETRVPVPAVPAIGKPLLPSPSAVRRAGQR